MDGSNHEFVPHPEETALRYGFLRNRYIISNKVSNTIFRIIFVLLAACCFYNELDSLIQIRNVFHDDEVIIHNVERDELLAASPTKTDGYITVPRVVEN